MLYRALNYTQFGMIYFDKLEDLQACAGQSKWRMYTLEVFGLDADAIKELEGVK